jgi:ribulose-phosphate 3-epimerase
MRGAELAPSILAADFSHLGEEVSKVEKYSKRLHVDVMDGHFVPNLSMGPAVVASLKGKTHLPMEVHLMVERPQDFIEDFIRAGAARLIFHAEVSKNPKELARAIKKAGAAVGIAINPETPFDRLEEGIEEVDLLLCMTVNPGFGGQAFLDEVLPKVRQAQTALTAGGLNVDIEVDGGINSVTGPRAREAGANVFVAGNSIFGDEDPDAAARKLAEAIGAEVY